MHPLQEPVLFAADIFTNICFGTPGASEEQVHAAARAANAAAFIERLPEGYHTQVRCRASACHLPINSMEP
jgi:ATP-binding cassette subfamily B protein